ncbi:fimbrial protein [Salmonella enterica]|nr:fimbrial protein [Salmonella enterica]
MKPGILCINLYLLLAGSAFASTTVDSEFVITNRKIDSYHFESTDVTATFTDTTGNGLYLIHDNFTDANIPDLLKYGNQQLGFSRSNSLIRIKMTGQKLGHSFVVSAKYAKSSFMVTNKKSVYAYYPNLVNNGCYSVQPDSVVNGATDVIYTIDSGSNMNTNCTGKTADAIFNYPDERGMYTKGIERDVYLDLESLQNDKAYRDAPPDTYVGMNNFSAETIKNTVGNGYPINYVNKITIIKNPYFENVTLPPDDNIFDIRNVGSDVRGNLVIPYVINGYFTPYNSITLSVTSLNDFKLKDANFNEIPYSLTTGIGSQKEYSLVTSGVSNVTTVTINNLTNENYALQGRFNANFSVNKSFVQSGEYRDILTVIFQIAL